MKRLLIALAMLALSAIACENLSDGAATVAPSGIAGDAVHTPAPILTVEGRIEANIIAPTQTAEARDVALYLEGIHAQGTAQAAQGTADAYAAIQTSTAQAIAAQQTAAAEQRNGAGTQAAWQATATAAERQYQANAQSTQIAVTRQAANDAGTQAAWQMTAAADAAESTRAAETQATYLRWTQEAVSRQATADLAGIQAQSTAVAAQAQLAELAAQRAALTNQVTAAVPYVLLAVAAVLIAWLIWRVGRALAMQQSVVRDPQGYPNFVGDERAGQLNILIPNKSVWPALSSGNTGVGYPTTSPETQARITENAQISDVLRLSATATQTAAQGLLSRLLGKPTHAPAQPTTYEPRIEIVEADAVREILEEVRTKLG